MHRSSGSGRRSSAARASSPPCSRSSPRCCACSSPSAARRRETTLLPPGSTGIVVLDASASISSDTYARIAGTLNRLIATKGAYGLVLFSDTAYQALPPRTPARELKPIVRFFDVPERTTPGALPETPRSPWTDSFGGGTRISTGLTLALDVIRADKLPRPGRRPRQRPRRRRRRPRSAQSDRDCVPPSRDPAQRRRAQRRGRRRGVHQEARARHGHVHAGAASLGVLDHRRRVVPIAR